MDPKKRIPSFMQATGCSTSIEVSGYRGDKSAPFSLWTRGVAPGGSWVLQHRTSPDGDTTEYLRVRVDPLSVQEGDAITWDAILKSEIAETHVLVFHSPKRESFISTLMSMGACISEDIVIAGELQALPTEWASSAVGNSEPSDRVACSAHIGVHHKSSGREGAPE